MKCALVWLSAILATACVAHASMIFSQDFLSSADVSSYKSDTPNSGQWNDIQGGYLMYQKLVFDRTSSSANSGSFTRSSDFSPLPKAIVYSFDLTVGPAPNSIGSSWQSADRAAVWQVGCGFSPTLNAAEASSQVNSEFGLKFLSSKGVFQFLGGGDVYGQSFTADRDHTSKILWVINESGGSITYPAPDNSTRTVSNNSWDLWNGTWFVFHDKPANPAIPLTDLKFAFASGAGSIILDNISIQDLTAVPEPSTGWVTAAFVGIVIGASSLARRFRTKRPLS